RGGSAHVLTTGGPTHVERLESGAGGVSHGQLSCGGRLLTDGGEQLRTRAHKRRNPFAGDPKQPREERCRSTGAAQTPLALTEKKTCLHHPHWMMRRSRCRQSAACIRHRCVNVVERETHEGRCTGN